MTTEAAAGRRSESDAGGPVGAVILAGGTARRFGSDKTRAVVAGEPLLTRVVAAVEEIVDELVVIGPWAPTGYRNIIEPNRSQGPLAALRFGIGQITTPLVLALAADHPHLSPLLLDHLVRTISDPEDRYDAIVPRTAHGPEPLVACYRASVVEAAAELVDSGERRMSALLATLSVRWVEIDEWSSIDPSGRSFMDIDTREDLEQLGRSCE